MLAAHLVPGYFAAVASRSAWNPSWSNSQRAILWVAALTSTVLPDSDVVYNLLFRGFINHSTLWTHSIFVHFGIGLFWLALRAIKRWRYAETLLRVITVAGLSHLVLDVLSHGTPLFYPVSMVMVGMPSARVLEGGFWAYITDPIFLAEPVLIALAVIHWIAHQKLAFPAKRALILTVAACLILFVAIFVTFLPFLQSAVAF